MTQPHHTHACPDYAALYALGALAPEAIQRFAAHLQTGCRWCCDKVKAMEGVVELLGYGVPTAAPSPEVRTRLLNRL